MANSQKAAFFERYAPLAIEQQQKYGIPASVTLAQAWWERGAANTANNFFGIKADSSWLREGKPYMEFKDDERGLSKFRQYGSIEESFEDHSRFLLQNRRYSSVRNCASDDYSGWLNGLKTGGYSTNPNYVSNLEQDICAYNLSRYDQMAIEGARSKGIAIGYARGSSTPSQSMSSASTSYMASASQNCYCLPVGDGTGLVVTSLYGHRDAPTKGASSEHNGIDIRAKYENVYSMENGHVVSVGSDSRSGNYIVVEYERADGKNYRVSFCHLDKNGIFVKEGDNIAAGTTIARSGSSGTSTAPHLHLTVRQSDGSGNYVHVNPLDYLAEISVRGGLAGTVVKKGTSVDLLASRKSSVDTTPTPLDVLLAQQSGWNLSPVQRQNIDQGMMQNAFNGNADYEKQNMLAYLMGQSGKEEQGGDLISELVRGLFVGAIGMAIQLNQFGKGGNDDIYASNAQPEQNEEERANTLLRRQRESIDPVYAQEMARMKFNTEYPEKVEENVIKLA